jgi:hypothetical protein
MTDDARVQALEATIARLEHRLGTLEDVHAIRRLHHLYGYYLDKCLYRQVVDLFADDGEVWFFGGKFRGKASVARLYIDRFCKNFTGGVNGPVYGFLLDHPQHQDVVDVAADRQTAQARFRCTMQAGRHELAGEPRQWFEGGLYENEYVNEAGVWKIKLLNYAPQWHADYETGWAHTRPNYVPFFDRTFPEDPVGPDELDRGAWLWPDTGVVPFHCPHPVTGEVVTPEIPDAK